MASPLFPSTHLHGPAWQAAAAVPSGRETCPGKDPVDPSCTCPDLVYSTRVRLKTGVTFNSYIYCGCCDLPIHPDSPGLRRGTSEGEGTTVKG